jgi:pimeloyl-[acyl-carrier protein] synthase
MNLLRWPDQWREVGADPGVSEQAVEELLRYVTPSQWMNRRSIAATTIAVIDVEANQTIIGLRWCASHDPSVFPDPDRLDIRRPNARRHIALGFGPHYCLGQALARLEAAIAIPKLARRFPNLELAAETLEWTGPASLRRLVSLPVTL